MVLIRISTLFLQTTVTAMRAAYVNT